MGAKKPLYYKLYYVHACLRRYKSRKYKRIQVRKPEWRATPTTQQRLMGKQKIQKMFDMIPQIVDFLDAFPEIDF